MARIKIIDDDLEFAENTAAVLRQAGHEVTLLDRTDDAVPILVEEQPDLVLLDVMFPANPVAGFDLARLIRHTREIRRLPVILLTGVNQEFPMGFSANDIDPDWMPVQDFIEKPFEAKRLLEAVRRMLEKS